MKNKVLAVLFLELVLCVSFLNAQVFRRFNPEDKLNISLESKLKLTKKGSMQYSSNFITELDWNQFIADAKKSAKGKKYKLSSEYGTSETQPATQAAWDIVVWCNMVSEINGYKPVYIDEQGSVIRSVPTDRYDYFMENWGIGGEQSRKKQVVKVDLTADGFRLPTKDELKIIFAGASSTTAEFLYQYAEYTPFEGALQNYSENYAYSATQSSIENNSRGNNSRYYSSSSSYKEKRIAGMQDKGTGAYTNYSFYVVKNK